MAAESSVLQAIRGRLADKPVLDLHPLWAVLAFGASIDGLLCLSDPLAETRYARPKHIAGHQHTAVRALHEYRQPRIETTFARAVSARFDRCVSCRAGDRPQWVTPLGIHASGRTRRVRRIHRFTAAPPPGCGERRRERRRDRRRRRSCRPVLVDLGRHIALHSGACSSPALCGRFTPMRGGRMA